MRNPFKFFKSSAEKKAVNPEPLPITEPEDQAITNTVEEETPPAEEVPDDGFVEWCRSQVRGGIERRERNNIYEAYSVYGKSAGGQLTCRYYHRYPEHERDFDLSNERTLNFTDFNRRLFSELDKGDIRLTDYNACIGEALRLDDATVSNDISYEGFTDEENAVLRDFCESMDTLTDKEYRGGDGIFRCSCRGAVGDDTLSLWFRKPLCHDALYTDVAGVSRTPVEGYDIDNLWIMGIYNPSAAQKQQFAVISERQSALRLVQVHPVQLRRPLQRQNIGAALVELEKITAVLVEQGEMGGHNDLVAVDGSDRKSVV